MHLQTLLDTSLAQFGDRPVLLSGERAISYTELEQTAQQLAEKLAQHGCSGGAIVLARVSSGANFLALLLATLRERLVFAPCAPSISDARLAEWAQQLGAGLVLTENMQRDLVFEASMPHPADANFKTLFSDGGFVRHTSGTTAAAKGVFVSYQAALARVQSAQQGLALPQAVRMLWPLEMAQHFVAVLPLVLLQGGAFVLPDASDMQALARCIERHSVTTLYAAPLHIQLLASARPVQHSLQRVFCTTAPLAAQTAERFISIWGLPVERVYGIFELGIVAAHPRPATRGPQPEGVGKALPGVSIRIVRADGTHASFGEVGRVSVLTPGLCDAYLKPLRLRGEFAKNGWFETDDLGQLNAQGELSLCGRASSVISVAGAKVFPEEVEDVLTSLPGIVAARVSACSHEILGNTLRAEVVLSEGQTLDETSIRQQCRKRLERYAVPQKIEQVQQLPLSEGGKIARY